jgi:NAD(P)-dependent dehydrogenase (short-subunit alcohol dehydrogenase family)
MTTLVTGASKGIGAAIALKLAADGATVAVNYSTSKQGGDGVVGKSRPQAARRSRCTATSPIRTPPRRWSMTPSRRWGRSTCW